MQNDPSRGGSALALTAPTAPLRLGELRMHRPAPAARAALGRAARLQRPQHAARLEPRQNVLGPLGSDRLAERLAPHVLARNLARTQALQPAHDTAGGARPPPPPP